MTHDHIKPVSFMHQDGLSNLEKQAVLDGASALICLARVSGVRLTDFGVWKSDDFQNPDGSLKPYHSVDWYVQYGRETSRDDIQLDGDTLFLSLFLEPWRDPQQGGQDHYDLFVVREDMYSDGTNFVIGLAKSSIGTVFSTYRFRELDPWMKYECLKTETMHELGHVFGLIPAERTQNVEKSLGKHCTNICTMRQGLRLPDDWIRITQDRLRVGALCSTCEWDLKNYFRR